MRRDREDEKNGVPAPAPEPRFDPDATVAAAPDPDATVAAASDPDATVAASSAPDADEGPARPVPPDDLPTIAVVRAVDEVADGIDALDDPYFQAAAPDELTSARAPVSIPSPVQSLPERRRRIPRWAVALLAVALLAVGALVALYTYDRELWGGRTVPAVTGMGQEEATETLEALGFVVQVEPVAADDGIGLVLASDPEEGRRVDPAAGITISVASSRVVPEVVGLDVERARQALSEAGALNIEIGYESSGQPADTVLSVSPGEGEPFLSSDRVTLVVASAFTVPNVLGMELSAARDLLAQGGFSATVSYVESSSPSGTVVGTSPEVGTEVAGGSSVELQVAVTYPRDPYDLLAYFDVAPQALSGYLAQEGFSPLFGGVSAATGNADAGYEGPGGELLRLSDYPETGHYGGDASRADVLAQGAGVGGVRYAFSSATLPEGGSEMNEDGLRAVMRACRLEGLEDTCTHEDLVAPVASAGEGDAASSPSFVCGVGRQGGYVWSVIIGGYDGQVRVVALAAPESHFAGVDLSDFGGSLCDYIAYIDLYTG